MPSDRLHISSHTVARQRGILTRFPPRPEERGRANQNVVKELNKTWKESTRRRVWKSTFAIPEYVRSNQFVIPSEARNLGLPGAKKADSLRLRSGQALAPKTGARNDSTVFALLVRGGTTACAGRRADRSAAVAKGPVRSRASCRVRRGQCSPPVHRWPAGHFSAGTGD